MRVAFLGSDDFGAIGLKALVESSHRVVLVVTVPDRPRGRGRSIEPGPVRRIAESRQIPFIQPESIKEAGAKQSLLDTSPDIIAVVCYGEYLPRSVYDASPRKAINVHPSLLPRWRGASPVHYTLLAGDNVTGVTVQYVEKHMDAGDILLQREVPVDPDEDHGRLSDRLYILGGQMLIEAIDGLEKEILTPRKQDESKATAAPKIRKSDLWLDWLNTAEQVRNRIRAFSPAPGARALFHGENCKVLRASREFRPLPGPTEPGAIVSLDKEGPIVACADAGIIITQIQPPGGKPVSGRDFINGRRPQVGERFEGAPAGGEV
jgi:methionyl-tRNA formyltransferase